MTMYGKGQRQVEPQTGRMLLEPRRQMGVWEQRGTVRTERNSCRAIQDTKASAINRGYWQWGTGRY